MEMLPPPDLYQSRRRRLCHNNAEGFLLLVRTDAPFYEDLYYLTGLTTYQSALLLDLSSGEETVWVWPFEFDEARQQTDVRNVISSNSVLEDAMRAIARVDPKKAFLGIRGEGYLGQLVEVFYKTRGKSLFDASILTSPLRQIKDSWEVCRLEEAQRHAQIVMSGVLDALKPGISERDIACEIVAGLVGAGATRPSFPIVAFGENTVRTHHLASDRKLNRVDLVLIDIFGEAGHNYCAELTETIVFGRGDPETQNKIDVVNATLGNLVSLARPGITIAELEEQAGRLLTAAGVREGYLGACAHDVGLCEHDPTDKTLPLAPGRVIALEPGIYLSRARVGIRRERVITI